MYIFVAFLQLQDFEKDFDDMNSKKMIFVLRSSVRSSRLDEGHKM